MGLPQKPAGDHDAGTQNILQCITKFRERPDIAREMESQEWSPLNLPDGWLGIVWFLKYKESWKSSVLYIARGSQATNRACCGCPDIHRLNSSYHWTSNLTLKCCAKESLLDVQAFIRNIETEVLKEICFHYVSHLFPWVIYFIYCLENQVIFFFVLFSGSWITKFD